MKMGCGEAMAIKSVQCHAQVLVSMFLFRQCRYQSPHQMRRKRSAAAGFVELIDDLVELVRVWQAVALAHVFADQLAQSLFLLIVDFRRFGSRLAELGQFSGLAKIEQMPPGLAFFGLFLAMLGAI